MFKNRIQTMKKGKNMGTLRAHYK